MIGGMQFYSIEGGPKTVTFAHGPLPGFETDSPTVCLMGLTVTTFTTPCPAAQIGKQETSSRRGFAVRPFFYSAVVSTGAVMNGAMPGEFESAAFLGTSVYGSGGILSNTVITPTVLPPTTFDDASVQPWTFVVSALLPSGASLSVASMWEGVTSLPSTLVLSAGTFPTSSLLSDAAAFTPSFTECTTVPLPGVPTPPMVAAALSFALGGSFVISGGFVYL